jgi:transcriptional regulator with XRE-family HTH domain
MTGSEYRKIRQAAGLSLTELARLIEVDRQTISNREREVPGYRIGKEAALAIREVCGVAIHKEGPSGPARKRK